MADNLPAMADDPTPAREAGGRWKRGSSGNPGGKTRAQKDVMREVRDAAGSYAPEALKTLVNILRNRRVSPTTRIAAASAILDRAVGKPAVPPAVNFADGSDLPVMDGPDRSALEKARRIAYLLAAGLRGLPPSLPASVSTDVDEGETE